MRMLVAASHRARRDNELRWRELVNIATNSKSDPTLAIIPNVTEAALKVLANTGC